MQAPDGAAASQSGVILSRASSSNGTPACYVRRGECLLSDEYCYENEVRILAKADCAVDSSTNNQQSRQGRSSARPLTTETLAPNAADGSQPDPHFLIAALRRFCGKRHAGNAAHHVCWQRGRWGGRHAGHWVRLSGWRAQAGSVSEPGCRRGQTGDTLATVLTASGVRRRGRSEQLLE